MANKEDIVDVRKEIVDVRKEIGDVRKELADFKLATKEEFAGVRKELVDFKLATKDDFAGVRKEITATREDMSALKYELSSKIANSIRWSFLFWIGQAATTFGILYLVLKK